MVAASSGNNIDYIQRYDCSSSNITSLLFCLYAFLNAENL